MNTFKVMSRPVHTGTEVDMRATKVDMRGNKSRYERNKGR